MPGSRKLGRSSDHRKAMLRAMVTFLLENGKIETTVTRAKEVRAMTEKMITLGKSNNLHSKRQVLAYVTKEGVAKKVFDEKTGLCYCMEISNSRFYGLQFFDRTMDSFFCSYFCT